MKQEKKKSLPGGLIYSISFQGNKQDCTPELLSARCEIPQEKESPVKSVTSPVLVKS